MYVASPPCISIYFNSLFRPHSVPIRPLSLSTQHVIAYTHKQIKRKIYHVNWAIILYIYSYIGVWMRVQHVIQVCERYVVRVLALNQNWRILDGGIHKFVASKWKWFHCECLHSGCVICGVSHLLGAQQNWLINRTEKKSLFAGVTADWFRGVLVSYTHTHARENVGSSPADITES